MFEADPDPQQSWLRSIDIFVTYFPVNTGDELFLVKVGFVLTILELFKWPLTKLDIVTSKLAITGTGK